MIHIWWNDKTAKSNSQFGLCTNKKNPTKNKKATHFMYNKKRRKMPWMIKQVSASLVPAATDGLPENSKWNGTL